MDSENIEICLFITQKKLNENGETWLHFKLKVQVLKSGGRNS